MTFSLCYLSDLDVLTLPPLHLRFSRNDTSLALSHTVTFFPSFNITRQPLPNFLTVASSALLDYIYEQNEPSECAIKKLSVTKSDHHDVHNLLNIHLMSTCRRDHRLGFIVPKSIDYILLDVERMVISGLETFQNYYQPGIDENEAF